MIGASLTESQLLIAGLASGVGLVSIVMRALVAAPIRESDAYQRGIADEAKRSGEDVDAMKLECQSLNQEIVKLRVALLRLAVASRLTASQRKEIAQVLGYRELPASLPVLPSDPPRGAP